MMSISIPCMANPNNSAKESFSTSFLCFKSIHLCLHLLVFFDNLLLGAVGEYRDILEPKRRLEEILSVKAVLLGVLPWQILPVIVDGRVN